MDDLMGLIAPLIIICMLGMGCVGIRFLYGYFVTGEVDGIPSGIGDLIAGILLTGIGGVVFCAVSFMSIAVIVTKIQERRGRKGM
jgi:hypothetical protein